MLEFILLSLLEPSYRQVLNTIKSSPLIEIRQNFSELLTTSKEKTYEELGDFTQFFQTATGIFSDNKRSKQSIEEVELFIEEELSKGNLGSAFEKSIQLNALVKVYRPNDEKHILKQKEKSKKIYETIIQHEARASLLLNARDEIFLHLLETRENFIQQSEDLETTNREKIENKLTQAEQILLTISTYVEKDELQSAIELLEQAEQYIIESEMLLIQQS